VSFRVLSEKERKGEMHEIESDAANWRGDGVGVIREAWQIKGSTRREGSELRSE
jgi:hypothetical protein